MKVLLATTMALGVVLTLGSTPPADATVIHPTVSANQHNQITPVYYRRYYYDNGPTYYYDGPGYGYSRGDHLLQFGPIGIF